MLRSDDRVWIRRLALVTAMAEFAMSLLLLRGFQPDTAAYQFGESRKWLAAPPINYHLGMDGISLFLVLLATFLTPIAMLASWESIQTRAREFFLMMLVPETGMIGVFPALHLFLFFVFWEVMLNPMYFLIGDWGHEARIYPAGKFVLYARFGSFLLLWSLL